VVAAECLLRKEAELVARDRCETCWHARPHCICDAVTPVALRLDVRFMLYIHYLEYANAGDDGKLLRLLAPGHTDLCVFGRPGDDELLRAALEGRHALLLFPSEIAHTVGDLARLGITFGEAAKAAGCEAAAGSQRVAGPHVQPAANASLSASGVSIVVLDGTWKQVRAMRRHFYRTPGLSEVPEIKLEPASLAYWAARGGASVYSRTQSQPDRVCTLEAIALLLVEYKTTYPAQRPFPQHPRSYPKIKFC